MKIYVKLGFLLCLMLSLCSCEEECDYNREPDPCGEPCDSFCQKQGAQCFAQYGWFLCPDRNDCYCVKPCEQKALAVCQKRPSSGETPNNPTTTVKPAKLTVTTTTVKPVTENQCSPFLFSEQCSNECESQCLSLNRKCSSSYSNFYCQQYNPCYCVNHCVWWYYPIGDCISTSQSQSPGNSYPWNYK